MSKAKTNKKTLLNWKMLFQLLECMALNERRNELFKGGFRKLFKLECNSLQETRLGIQLAKKQNSKTTKHQKNNRLFIHYKKRVYCDGYFRKKWRFRRIIRLWWYRVLPEFLPPQSLMWRSIENCCSKRHIMHCIKWRF